MLGDPRQTPPVASCRPARPLSLGDGVDYQLKLSRLVPKPVKPLLRPIYQTIASTKFYRRLFYHPGSVEQLQSYWRHWDGSNPDFFLKGEWRSRLLVEMVRKYAGTDARILELGCNLGRNLNFLMVSGYSKLYGLEINEAAIRLLAKNYPELANVATIYHSSIEEKIREFNDGEFDVVFTMHVLQHVHEESAWVFSEIVRTTKQVLITVEEERYFDSIHFARNYKDVFESRGMKQVEYSLVEKVGLAGEVNARTFVKVPKGPALRSDLLQ